jgi:hypothetical protein
MLGFQGGNTTHPRCRNRLAVAMITHIPGSEEPWNVGMTAMLDLYVPIFIENEAGVLKNGRFGGMANGNKYPF